ncbi:MAG: nitroreductase family protein [Anaerolineae bacterium]
MDNAAPLLSAITSRRSIRRYTSEPVTSEQAEMLIDAAWAAPSGNGKRAWHFVVVMGQEGREALSEVHRWAHMVAQAPLAIAVCADLGQAPTFWIDDCSAAAQNILVAANAMGLGGVWIGIHHSEGYQQYVRGTLGLPPHLGVHCLLAIGHPAEEKPAHGRHYEAHLHWERW